MRYRAEQAERLCLFPGDLERFYSACAEPEKLRQLREIKGRHR